MKVVDLVSKDGLFHYDVFDKLDSEKQEYLIDLYKTFLETYSSLCFVFSDKGFKAIMPEEQQEYYCNHYFSDYDDEDDDMYIPYFGILNVEGVNFIEPRFNSIMYGARYFLANYEEI